MGFEEFQPRHLTCEDGNLVADFPINSIFSVLLNEHFLISEISKSREVKNCKRKKFNIKEHITVSGAWRLM